VKGIWREGSLAGEPRGEIEKARETGTFSIGTSLGDLEGGSSNGDIVRRIWGI
jgi:hypothetical protein